jgi:hypothetical protein
MVYVSVKMGHLLSDGIDPFLSICRFRLGAHRVPAELEELHVEGKT